MLLFNLEFLSIFPLTKYELLRGMDSQQSTEFVENEPSRSINHGEKIRPPHRIVYFMNRLRVVALSSLLALFGTMALVPVLGVGPFPGVAASSSGTPSWASAGSFLDYQINANASVTALLPANSYSGGSEFSFNYTMQGTMNLLINGVSGENANVSFTPNLTIKTGITFPNGTLNTQTQSETSANATSFLLPLSSFGSNNIFSDSNLSSLGGLSFFSPNLNISLNQSPAALYNWNGKSVAAIHFDSNITENQSFSGGQGLGLTGSLSLNGTLNGYYTAVQDLPLYVGLKLTGSINISGVTGNIHSGLTLSLTNTNIDLGSGQTQEVTFNIPGYSTSIYVLSNSTIQSSSTSGNQLLVSVSGPSGTQGYISVVVSQQLLSRAGVTDPSQIQVSLDGQAYSNYSVFQVGGNYVILVHYHHSSHNVAMSIGNANLGSNTGSISTLGGSSGQSFLSGENLYLLVAAVVIIVVLAGVLAAMRSRKHGVAGQTSPATTSAPATSV